MELVNDSATYSLEEEELTSGSVEAAVECNILFRMKKKN